MKIKLLNALSRVLWFIGLPEMSLRAHCAARRLQTTK